MRSNFYFDAYDDAMPAWRYPDLTNQPEHIVEVLHVTIEVEMSKEGSYRRDMELAREGVKKILEGPNSDIDQDHPIRQGERMKGVQQAH